MTHNRTSDGVSPEQPRPDVDRVLVVTAHPDDVDFGAAGTIAAWTQAGVEVSYCLVTYGEAGGFDDSSREAMRERREEEQRKAAAVVGVRDVVFLDYPDGRVEASLELRKDISRVIRQRRPQRILTTSPEMNWAHIVTSHPDHRAVGDATLSAVYPDARNRYAHPGLLSDEGLQPWEVAEVWLMAGPQEHWNYAVDITDRAHIKFEALRSHISQVEHREELEAELSKGLGHNAALFALPEGRLAEVFHVVSTR